MLLLARGEWVGRQEDGLVAVGHGQEAVRVLSQAAAGVAAAGKQSRRSAYAVDLRWIESDREARTRTRTRVMWPCRTAESVESEARAGVHKIDVYQHFRKLE